METKKQTNYWKISPGEKAKYWDDWKQNNYIAIGWNSIDVNQSNIKKQVEENKDYDNDPEHVKRQFGYITKEMEIGDIVLAYGNKQILGVGKIESEYYFDKTKENFKHIRKVTWIVKKPIDATKFGDDFYNKIKHQNTIIPISEKEHIDIIQNKILSLAEPFKNKNEINYFWITSNPKIWSVGQIKDGGEVFYTAYNKKGNKRRIFSAFEEVQSGDKVIFYESTPRKNIVALGEVVKKLHQEEEEGYDTPVEGITIKYLRDVEPIAWEELIEVEDLEDSEPMRNRAQGSLFRLTKKEYENIMALEEISEAKQKKEVPIVDFDQQIEIEDLYFSDKEIILRRVQAALKKISILF